MESASEAERWDGYDEDSVVIIEYSREVFFFFYRSEVTKGSDGIPD